MKKYWFFGIFFYLLTIISLSMMLFVFAKGEMPIIYLHIATGSFFSFGTAFVLMARKDEYSEEKTRRKQKASNPEVEVIRG